MNMLAIDTSTQTMGVALLNQNKIVAELTTDNYNDHSRRLMPAIHDLMQQATMTPESLDCIVTTNGPGSYTGTRIGVTTAKTLGWVLDIPVKTVSTLKLGAYNGVHFKGYICPFIDARRGTVYTALYCGRHGHLEIVKPATNILFSKWLDTFSDWDEPILFLSGDMPTYKELIEETCPNAIIPAPSTQRMHPSHLFKLADDESDQNVHEIVPNYLRLTEAEANWLKKTAVEKDGSEDG